MYFLFRAALAIWCLFQFHTNASAFCSISMKNAIDILIGIALTQIALCNMDILTILILPFHEHKISISLCLNFFQNCFVVFSVQVLHLLCCLLFHILITFVATVNGSIFFIFLSDILSSIYRNLTFLYINFILYNFTYSFIVSNRFLLESLGLTLQKIMSSASSEF